MENTLLSIVLASSVIASIITAIFGIYNLKQTNKGNKDIETLKNDNTIQIFRYTKLFELNIALYDNIPDVNNDYTEIKDGKKVIIRDKYIIAVSNSAYRFSLIKKMFNKSKPLFKEDYYATINGLFDAEDREVYNLNKALDTGSKTDITSLFDYRKGAEDKLKEIIYKQLSELIN